MSEKVSVIIPVYNVEKYLDKCLKSVVEQSYKDIEIIIVNDGSTDSSPKIIDKWKDKDKRIVVIHKKNGGLSSARNAGIDIATGAYLTFIDSDDFVDSEYVQYLYDMLFQNSADISICNRVYVKENSDKFMRFLDKDIFLIMNSKEAIEQLNLYKNYDMSAWAKLYKKELFNNICFPIGKTSEDFYIMYKLFYCSNRIVYSSKPLYYYLQRDGSISQKKQINFDYLDAAYNQLNDVTKVFPELTDCLRSSYASASMTVYNSVIKNNGKCTREERKILQEVVKNNYGSIRRYKRLSQTKKIQAFIFIKLFFLYDFLFFVAKKFNRY